jgi:hypothetical protein
MLTRIHQRLGTAGFLIAIVALVAALGGSALAASGALTGKQKKEVEKIAKKYAGKPGANGANGAPGPAGAPGPKGDGGAAGTNGTNGTSVTATAVTTSETGKCSGHGGAEFKAGSGTATFACNGQTGFTETLPSGKTETGTWAIAETSDLTDATYAALSFPIPVDVKEGASGPEAENTAWIFSETQVSAGKFGKDEASGLVNGCTPGESGCLDTGCRGTAAEPEAPPGTLCVYTVTGAGATGSEGTPEVRAVAPFAFNGYGPTGALIVGPTLKGTAATPVTIEQFGTWAVTAP